jgi:hydrogenase maturation protein HypF
MTTMPASARYRPNDRDARAAVARRRWRITGQVQGVGFRPFVYRAARSLGLTGRVGNDTDGVFIEAQGPAAALDALANALRHDAPPLARIDSIDAADIDAVAAERAFVIVQSESHQTLRAAVTVDTAMCDDCRRELFSSADRRYRYGLINCTHCGPRYSIIRKVPYDRPNTTMAGFELCPTCAGEYADPLDRRFHAQPTACEHCGPTVALVDGEGQPIDGDPYEQAAQLLADGRIVAIKGLGGFHLAVRADDEQAVQRLRKRKHRDAKPFAVMCRDIEQVRKLVDVSNTAVAQMQSPACPIVLAARRVDAPIADAVAPGNHRLGVMLPYTPIQHLLFATEQLKPGTPLVMTSANTTDEPLVIDNAEALERLATIADAMLWHDRPIERAVDDSVLLDARHSGPLPIRRARGYAPAAIDLPVATDAPGLCVGGELKNTIALVRGGQAILGPHLGDLAHPLAYRYFTRAIDDMCELFGIEPQWIAHDLHPVYMSTRHALQYAAERNVRTIGVQHHYAHAASLMAEHHITQPTLALVADGVGYGVDRTMWGGELLLADLHGCRRIARLRPMNLPGGDAAARETRRCAFALLQQAFGDSFAEHTTAKQLVPDRHERTLLTTMMRNGVNCAVSSAAGRLFDGIAALLGICRRNSFEAQAGLALEAAASGATAAKHSRPLFEITDDDVHDDLLQIDMSPLVRHIVERGEADLRADVLAAVFHHQLAWAFAAAAERAMREHDVQTIGLTGGVFANQVLAEQLAARLRDAGAHVLTHSIVPAGDGGLSLGQAAHASATLPPLGGGLRGGASERAGSRGSAAADRSPTLPHPGPLPKGEGEGGH